MSNTDGLNVFQAWCMLICEMAWTVFSFTSTSVRMRSCKETRVK